MSYMHDGNNGTPKQDDEDDLEHLLTYGVPPALDVPKTPASTARPGVTESDDDDEVNMPLQGDIPDIQGALAVYAEAAQDMATASLELSLGRHFACVDFCNQAVEKAAQAVSVLRYGRRTSYNHDLRALGVAVDAPPEIVGEMEKLTPFHPEAFYAETPPEEADEVINAEQASAYVQSARTVMRWARDIVLRA